MESSGSGRGGARPGAGRPPKNGVSRARYRPILIRQEAYELLAGVGNKCEYVSSLILAAHAAGEKDKGS